jgi:hypothetical protein
MLGIVVRDAGCEEQYYKETCSEKRRRGLEVSWSIPGDYSPIFKPQ